MKLLVVDDYVFAAFEDVRVNPDDGFEVQAQEVGSVTWRRISSGGSSAGIAAAEVAAYVEFNVALPDGYPAEGKRYRYVDADTALVVEDAVPFEIPEPEYAYPVP